jgi:RNase H-like domain found in reverse transcriptase/Integrase zinc binding domain
VKFCWNKKHDEALQTLKDLLLQNATLHFANMDDTMFVQSDASRFGIAHTLMQKVNGKFKVIAFGGRSFKKHEKVLSSCDSELIGIMDAIHSYRQFLHNGKPFKILTDSLSMSYLKTLSYEKSPRLTRYALLLQNLDFEIEHIKGNTNIVPDFLSRYRLEDNDLPIDKVPKDSILDIDHYNFLNAITIDSDADRATDRVGPSNVRNAKYKIYTMMAVERDVNTTQKKRVGRERYQNECAIKKRTDRTRETPRRNKTPQDTTEDILDIADEHCMTQSMEQLKPLIDLDNQADSPFMTAMIEYLSKDTLPTDANLARSVILHAPDYVIHDNQLFHLGRLSKKNRVKKILPRSEQLVVPRQYCFMIMQSVHELSHFGFTKNYLTIKMKYFWKEMQKDVKDYASSCLICQQIKTSPSQQYPMHSIPVAQNIFQTIQIDIHSIATQPRGSKIDPQ